MTRRVAVDPTSGTRCFLHGGDPWNLIAGCPPGCDAPMIPNAPVRPPTALEAAGFRSAPVVPPAPRAVAQSPVQPAGGLIVAGKGQVGSAVMPPAPPDPVAELLGRMLDRDALDRIPPPRPLIDGLLDLESESWVIGAPGEFKSFVALDWACHVALGLPWQNRTTEQGPVVYMAAEGGKGIRQRVRAWEATYGKRVEGLSVLPEPVQVSDVRRWGVLTEACKRIQPVLIVLDTQARITVGLDENSNGAMTQLTEAVRYLKAQTKACVLVVHHTGRNGKDARGASAIDGAQDTEIKVSRPERGAERDSLRATIKIEKQKDGDESIKLDVQLRVVDLGEENGRALSSLALVPFTPFGPPLAVSRPWRDNLCQNQQRIVDVLAEHVSPQTGETQERIKALVIERFGHMPKSSFSTAWKVLIETGKIGQIEGAGKVFHLVSALRATETSMNIGSVLSELNGRSGDHGSEVVRT